MHQLAPLENADQFENLICDLFNKLYNINDFVKFGKKGNLQKGIDIYSTEQDIVIQCKKKDLSRNKIILKKEILDEIEKEISHTQTKHLSLKFNKFYFVSTFDDNSEIIEYCEALKSEKKYNFEIIYWGWQTLTEKVLLYPDLLKKYWSNFVIEKSNTHQNLIDFELRKKMLDDFAQWNNYAPKNRKRNSRMIIRMYNSSQYPYTNEIDNTIDNYSWFAAEFKKISFDGVEFIISIKHIFINNNNEWCLTKSDKFPTIQSVLEVGKISFKDINNYDIRGDEFYNCPHFICDFKYNGTPFSEKYYQNINRPYLIYQ